MRSIGRWLGRVLLLCLAAIAALWLLGPYERVDLSPEFEPRRFGEGVQVYFESVESRHDDIIPGVEKRVVWQDGAYERRTAYAVLYIHGFSASSEEIRPVPDRLAEALGANLVYTRLSGHGRGSAALADVTATDWMGDLAEGLAAARAVGERVIVLATSTGGTLAAAAAVDPELGRDLAAIILVSPNFGLNDPAAFVLTLPAARHWLPVAMGGGERCFEPLNAAQARYWTTCYPWAALPPMAALVERVAALDFTQATVPALFYFSDDDSVVSADTTRRLAGDWGGPVESVAVTMGPGDDPSAHVIAGDIVSPGQTEAAVAIMLDWLARNGID
nr:alpha/beta hydrolase [Cribrihabitans marinus]